jgi:DnaJ-class molecular chaperone
MTLPRKSRRSFSSTLLLLLPFLILGGSMQFRYVQKQHEKVASVLPIKTIPCWNCEGKGDVQAIVGQGTQTPCPVCYGIGNRRIRFDPVNNAMCTGCQGMGFAEDKELGLVVQCPTCAGFGTMDKPAETGITITRFPVNDSTNAPPALHLLPGDTTLEPTP